LREEVESYVDDAKGSGTWPKIAGVKIRKEKGQQCPKINSKS